MISITVQDYLIMMYPNATRFSPRPIIIDSSDLFLTFYKMSNLKMNTVIDSQIYIFLVKVMVSRNYISNIWNGDFSYK